MRQVSIADVAFGADSAGRRELDLAKGIVMAWHGCDESRAFGALVQAAERHGVGTVRLAKDLVGVVSGAHTPSAAAAAAISDLSAEQP